MSSRLNFRYGSFIVKKMRTRYSALFLLAILSLSARVLAVEEGPSVSWLTGNEPSGPFLDYVDRFVSASSEEPFTPEDSTSAAKIKGEYRMNLGYEWRDTDDFIWKYANTEMLGYNFRYLYGEKRYNTFNPNIYDSFSLTLDVKPQTQWNAHMDIIVDPWAFVGETERTIVKSGWGAEIALNLPYWSNTGRTRNFTIRSNTGDTISIPEIQVRDGDTEPCNVRSGWGDRYFIPAIPIERDFRPVKNLWLDWNLTENSKVKVFPYLENAHALTSDDPFGLCNNHVYWEASPWLSYWTRGVEYSALGWEPGYWTVDTAEGRQGERLRLLRGIYLDSEEGNTSLEGMVASSLSPWNEYENINNISYAGRIKTFVTDSFMLGTTYTARTGMTDYDVESFEQAYSADCGIDLLPELRYETEAAFSYRGIDVTSVRKESFWGEAVTSRLCYNKTFDSGKTEYWFGYTYMADDFRPPLAAYSNTRNDQSWADHIEFKEHSEEDKKIKIGDGIDRNRQTFSLTNTTSLFGGKFESLSACRVAHTAEMGKFQESCFRNEIEASVSDCTSFKTLALIQKNPPNKDRETVYVFGAGANQRLNDQITVQGIYERANKYPYWPQASVNWFRIDPYPPYPFFNMYKIKFIFEPYENLVFECNHCRNGFKFASGLDDNINYDGIEMRWRACENLSTQVTYKYSRAIDVNELLDFRTENFMGHHNIYSETNWEIWKDKFLKIQFGDLGRFITRYRINPDSSTESSSIQPDVLDTQDIIRITFVGKF